MRSCTERGDVPFAIIGLQDTGIYNNTWMVEFADLPIVLIADCSLLRLLSYWTTEGFVEGIGPRIDTSYERYNRDVHRQKCSFILVALALVQCNCTGSLT